jgi:hypothetical protein
MYTTYHLTSAEDVNSDILEAIKVAFKSKPIKIVVYEDTKVDDLTNDLKFILDERMQEDETTYLSAEESINRLSEKYGL